MLKKQGGFTLIEMLVVVAIIGILPAAVLVALGPSRNKAKDARIVSGIQQARAIGETLYDPVSSSPYSKFVIAGNTALTAIQADVTAQGGTLVIDLSASGTAYAVYSKLASEATNFYCADSAGKVITSTNAPSSGACPAN